MNKPNRLFQAHHQSVICHLGQQPNKPGPYEIIAKTVRVVAFTLEVHPQPPVPTDEALAIQPMLRISAETEEEAAPASHSSWPSHTGSQSLKPLVPVMQPHNYMSI